MIGKTLAHYEVTSALGKGGMGEVWRARDTKLGRDVAIKTLPEAFAQDEERLARFEREAKLLAALNHPNIAAIYGLGSHQPERSAQRSGVAEREVVGVGPHDTNESRTIHYLVLELVEGETLADRLLRGPLGVEEALALARQIVEALEAAHERGVIHRDLKPANIKITADGKVKVLDFGLAKAFEGDEAGANLSNSPTLSRRATMAGVILGTAAYMSPEQAKGIPVDRRSDVFSFGCVLFEMLTGRRAFPGDLATEILASVIAREPDLSALPPNLHPQLKALLRRALEKDPKNRWQAVGDLRLELEPIAADPRGASVKPPEAVSPRASFRLVLPWVVATAFFVFLATWLLKPAPPPAPQPVRRFTYELPAGRDFTNTGRPLVDLSPDGERLVYVANNQLYVRSLAELEARPIPETDVSPTSPAFSPDGQWVAYWAQKDRTLKRIPLTGGAAVTLCEATNPFGVSWGTDDTLVYGQSDGIFGVSTNGGNPTLLVGTEEGESVHGPEILPGGATLLFTSTHSEDASRWDEAQIVVQSFDSGKRKVLWKGGSDARYLPTGHLVFARENVLFAVAFDLARLEVTGGPIPVTEGVRRATDGFTGSANYGLSANGTLVYVSGSGADSRQDVLALVDREGTVTPLDVPEAAYVAPRLSPDGTRLVVQSDGEEGSVLWVYDLSGEAAMRRLTFEGNNRRPLWTPDGKRITFTSDRDGTSSLYWKPADGSGPAERLTSAEVGVSHRAQGWSPDGRTLLFQSDTGGNNDLWAQKLGSGSEPEIVVHGENRPVRAALSPDGSWLAYSRGASIFVEPFPPTGASYQITREGGSLPVWSRDGKRLYFRGASTNTGALKTIDVTTTPVFRFSDEHELPITGFRVVSSYRSFDPAPGERFLMVVPTTEGESTEASRPSIQIVLNWVEELKARVPAP